MIQYWTADGTAYSFKGLTMTEWKRGEKSNRLKITEGDKLQMITQLESSAAEKLDSTDGMKRFARENGEWVPAVREFDAFFSKMASK